MITAESIWKDVESIREQRPLVHNITNYVVMNTTANALLALGASPVMAHALEEVEEMTSIVSALVINIGTLSPTWVESMYKAAATAKARELPVVLDPVGAGATTMRTETARGLLATEAVTTLRGNASEIMSLYTAEATTKGVDSTEGSEAAIEAAKHLSKQHGCAVTISGAIDIILDGQHQIMTGNGHPMMTKVTGLGCTASAITGAFAAVNPSPLMAAAHAMAVMGICGELAVEDAKGPGTLQLHFLDALYDLSFTKIEQHLKIVE